MRILNKPMKLTEILLPSLVIPELKASTKDEVLKELAVAVANCLSLDERELIKSLLERESARSTALERTGVAIPHARISGLAQFVLVVAKSKKGVPFGAEDNSPTRLFFLIVGPENNPGDYLKLLARVARICHGAEFRQRLLEANSAQEMLEIIKEEDAKS